ncbi:MAG: NosD domain-containing protein, partial [Methanobacteriota archaeon]
VRYNLCLDNLCGGVFLEPEGEVKNNPLTFTIDPPETCGVRTPRGHVVIRNNTIGTVTFGIDVVASTGAVTGNVLFETQTGIRLTGFSGMVAVDLVASGNVVVDARIGIDLVAFAGNVTANDIEGSSNVGIRIGLGGSAVLHANVVADGRVGIGSVACSGISCASATVRANVVAGNEEGMNLTGSFSFRANLATGNSGNGIVVTGSLVSQFDNASGNGANGFVVYGTLDAGNATATANVEAGFRVSGVLSVIHRANVSANGDGIIAIAVAIQLPPPPPPPTVTVPSMPAPPNQDPLIVFDSVIEDNFGYAVQADLTVLTDARYNFWGAATGPSIHLNPLARARGNVVSPNVLFTPWFEDRAMTTTVPPGF